MTTSPSRSTNAQPPSMMVLPDGLTADSIDTIPVLCETLSRLQNFSSNNPPAASPPGATPSFNAANTTGPLNIKDIFTATDARAGVKELPDMHRSIEEQQEEMKEYEEKIKQQKQVLQLLMNAGMEMKKEKEARDAMET
ncbi:hypothetical protein ACMFMF_008323 [Clarireedia jacksonii]